MSSIPNALRAPPPAPPIKDEALMRQSYRRWRVRMMVSMLIGYASFYLVRKNFSMAMPVFLEELNMSRTDLGIILSAFSILYGAGKFVNGMLADRANARWFMVIGLTGAALANFALIGVGFAIYGPQMLVGVAAADFASKHAAATATGLTGTFGYIGSALCGVGTGLVVDRWGWDGGFLLFLISSVLACVFFALTWNARAAVLATGAGLKEKADCAQDCEEEGR
jgi:sugar phosphate permease